ncbi:hypothetical protein BCR34DRAFT_551598 [Clohesyomyces aquaticus]|uniref:Uncharacterized protein n=1 Tax=Clohesyomyces aquaticus TaxID=1231657 RepID=A0A1Y2AB01_9PLEO|nr:hypothetical protein BCR34DRAFT_551598 [Clohesyomyces aquaticus]
MSTPPSDGRPSVSSEPSVASSHTLNSNSSGTYGNNGAGSSTRPSPAGSRHNSGAGRTPDGSPSKPSGENLGMEPIEEQDFAHRRRRNRRSAGFLLDSTFPTGPRSRDRTHGAAHTEDVNGKRAVRQSHGRGDASHHGRIPPAERPSSSSSPLSREVVTADRDAPEDRPRVDFAGVRDCNNGELRVPKARKSIRASSPAATDEDLGQERSRPIIDPSQIVHMALTLGEGRRRNLSAGQLIAPPRSGSTRVASAAIPPEGSFRSYGAGGSLRQYLNEQRRVSRNISPGTGRNSPSASRHASTTSPRITASPFQNQQFNPSEGTLARRDRAKAYIELRLEYLRLLDHLPPLKPDANAPGNFTVSAASVPGSPHAQLTRTASRMGAVYGLGRPYNPLQYIRNRRSRARERKALDHPPEEFLDTEKVRDWVDTVEVESQRPAYRGEDKVALPEYQCKQHAGKDSPNKPVRPRIGWTVYSEELLADAYWLEQEDHKILIEDRHGRKIFPPKEPPKQEFLQPHASKEYPEKRRKSWVEAVPRLSADIVTGDESDPASERGRKRRLLPAFRSESPKHKKHGWRGSRPHSANFPDSSDSDSDSQKRESRRIPRVIDINNNTGPLELRMRQMIEKEQEEAKANHPDVASPDTPDKWGGGHLEYADGSTARDSVEIVDMPNGNALARVDLKVPPKKRVKEILNLDSAREPRSSFEDLDSTAPNTPIRANLFPHIGADLSPPPSRDGSVTKKPKRSKLDVFRSDESVKGHKSEPDSAGADMKRSSRQTSEEIGEGNGIGNAILSAPGAVKSLLTHRKTESTTSLNSPEASQRNNRDSKEPASAVSRFFKGVKNEGSKVGEFIFRRDRPTEDTDAESESGQAHLDESDAGEELAKSKRKLRPHFSRNNTATSIGSATTQANSPYHLDLPSFRPSNHPDADQGYFTDTQLVDHPITRQARDRANSRSPRFSKLAPPRMDLRSISTASSPAPSRARSPSAGRERLNKTPERPGGVGRGGLPYTPLANGEGSAREKSISRPTLEGKRHWSITDDDGNTLHRKTSATGNTITRTDIARIRALFLCSGVKARGICQRAQEPRPNGPPAWLTRAAKAANAQLIPIARKEEHVLAARVLTRNLEASTQALHESSDRFRNSDVRDLVSNIRNLRSRIESDLFARVRDSADEAVRITSGVSGTAPLAVKQVSDEIDRMIRMRRRRMKWVRRVGWVLVEWALVGLMWWLWLIVTILGSVRRVFGAVWSVMKWLLWI